MTQGQAEFLAVIPKAQSIKEKNDKIDFIKNTNFYTMKNTVKGMKRQVTDWDMCKSRINKGHVFIQNTDTISKTVKLTEFFKEKN